MPKLKSEKVKLTRPKLDSLSKAGKGQRYEVLDTDTPGLRVRVNDQGRRTFMIRDRMLNGGSRLALGDYPVLALGDAREKARDWLKAIKGDKDPRKEEQKRKAAEQRRRKTTFAAVAEDFIAEKLPGERKGREVERDIRRDLIPEWGSRPITDISREEVASVVKEKKRTAPAQARNMLGTIKRIFQWAIDQAEYGIEESPAISLKPSALIGEKIARDRVLSDVELAALWRRVKRMPSPYGPVYRLLILTGLRLNEVARAQRSEFNFEKKLWTIPASRMKGKNSKAVPHEVPLTREILSILEKLPTFKGGDFLFSTAHGEKPVRMSGKVKKRLDACVLRSLRALAKKQDEDPAKLKMEHWENHDIRRTVRTNLSALPIQAEVREAVLAHVQQGVKAVYDRYKYLDEKRDALEKWAVRLRSIVEPPAPQQDNNVVHLRA